ncbi:hypothetical protein RUM43_009231 [Polyplax serrata]|uniref:Uncharacterized protein n=1 Tax=Polyplax serrata TaxID=468196 RepID=A0AAN8P7T0_POLSC
MEKRVHRAGGVKNAKLFDLQMVPRHFCANAHVYRTSLVHGNTNTSIRSRRRTLRLLLNAYQRLKKKKKKRRAKINWKRTLKCVAGTVDRAGDIIRQSEEEDPRLRVSRTGWAGDNNIKKGHKKVEEVRSN